MSFDNISAPTVMRAGVYGARPDNLMIALHAGGAKTDPILCIRIGPVLADKLGWRQGDFLSFHEGSGGHLGHFQITKTDSRNGRLLSASGSKDGSLIFRQPVAKLRNHSVPPDTRAQTECVIQAFAGMVTGVMPDWIVPAAAESDEAA